MEKNNKQKIINPKGGKITNTPNWLWLLIIVFIIFLIYYNTNPENNKFIIKCVQKTE